MKIYLGAVVALAGLFLASVCFLIALPANLLFWMGIGLVRYGRGMQDAAL